MRMKKRIIAIMIVTTMSFCLMACGADNNKEVATEEVVTEIESEQQEIEEPTESVQEIESTFLMTMKFMKIYVIYLILPL